MITLSDNTRGALFMMCSMAAFTFGDTFLKATGGALPLGELLLLRGVIASTAILALTWWLGALRISFSRRDWALVALRSLAEVAAAWFFLTALFHMPLANVTALLQMMPLTVTLGSALVFREAVGWRRWIAIGVGFVGMLLVVRPGTEGFNLYTVYALISVFCVTVRDLATRRLSGAVPSLMVTLFGAVTVTGFAGLLALSEPWMPLTPPLAWFVLAAAVLVVGGYVCSVMVMRVGQVSFVAPFRYTGLLWALLLGWLVFGEWPRTLTLIGAVIIVATGVFTLWREATLARRQKGVQPNIRRT
ncbi:DMT family transporter [Puniceibacterium sp. IMCC21224]|uniref:DMT family transporter n=1 Tax=Puniceibacterium sp. IMCC21224 TaxID=1618204 RepID=UPI00064DA783|nr:DMT family transporter [Puniceibacterium sp. IMCC21224]KMK68165.1 EamA-like transporter family [Puniceibacterium sp. IMCC21224]